MSNSDSLETETETDYDFLQEVEKTIEFKGVVTDFEWDLRSRQWDEQNEKVMGQILQNNIWNMIFHKHDHEPRQTLTSGLSKMPETAETTTPTTGETHPQHESEKEEKPSKKAKDLEPADIRMSQLELFTFLKEWDKSSYSKRNRMIKDFNIMYDTNEQDTDEVFANGGSLIFCRFTVSLHMCFLKHHKLSHYYDALGIFVKSLQSDRYVEEFLRLGGMYYIIQLVRIEDSDETDKLRALQFLVNLMISRNGHYVKQFILHNPNLLESLVDSLTMCKNRELIKNCGLIFENLCIEIPAPNITVIFDYVTHALPCDFNPILQSMAFKVLQGYIRMKPSLSIKCIKPILDNLKTNDSELLLAISGISLVILQTKYGHELISALMIAAEGLQLREVFKNVYKSHFEASKYKTTLGICQDIHNLREKRDKLRLKQMKFDQFMHQAGALFLLNQIMIQKVDFVIEFVNKGVFGLALKTLGSCPHWQVQGQGVTMVKFLFSVSMNCALSFYMMLPPRMIELLMTKPEECLRYFTSPICALLRKLGRFALKMWPRWVSKVLSVAKLYAKGPKIPPEIFQLSQMARKVHEIQQEIADLLDSPVMEAAPKTPNLSDTEFEDQQEFMDSSRDEDNLSQYKDAREFIMGDEKLQPFRRFVEEEDEYIVLEDRLDKPVEMPAAILLNAPDDDPEADSLQVSMFDDERKDSKDSQDSRRSSTLDGDFDFDGEDFGREGLHNKTVEDAPTPPELF